MKKTYSIVMLLVVGIGLVVWGVASRHSPTPSSAGNLKLGLMLPLSGDYAAAGQNMQKGMQLALDDYKKAHPESDITTVIEDDGYDAQKGVTAYKKLTSLDHVDAILMLSTPVIDAIHADVTKTKTPVIVLGVQTADIGKDNIFQFSPAAEAPIGYLATYLNSDPDFTTKKVAVIYDNSVAQLSFFKVFAKKYTHDFTPFMVNNKDDLRSFATQISKSGYAAVVVIESPQNGALFTKELLTLNPKLPLLAYDAQLQTGFADYARILGDTNKINGALSMWFKAGNVVNFQKEYQAKYNDSPGFLSDFAYDMIDVALNSYSSDPDAWLANIQNTNDPQGVSGAISFDANGVRLQPMTITKVTNGKITPIQ